MIFDTSEIQQHYTEEIWRLGESPSGLPSLACVYDSDDPSATSFVKSLKKKGETKNPNTGRNLVNVETVALSSGLSRLEIIVRILNEENGTHGILLASPPSSG